MTKDRDMFHEGFQDGLNARFRTLFAAEFTSQDRRDYTQGRQEGIQRRRELEAELEAEA